MMNFSKFKEEMAKAMRNPVTIVSLFALAVYVIILLLLPRAGEWTLYWIYYKPFYTIFRNNIYLPFYLHFMGSFFPFSLWSILILKFGLKKKSHKIICGFIIIIVIISMLKDFYKDVVFINDEKFKIVECNLDSLKRDKTSGSHGRLYYQIHSNEEIDNRYVYIQMDFYQYNELLKLKNGKTSGIIMVKYLPNTERMLKNE